MPDEQTYVMIGQQAEEIERLRKRIRELESKTENTSAVDESGNVVVLREPVAWFAGQMEAKLAQHDDRPGWWDESVGYLIRRIHEELDEVFDALLTENAAPVISECVDVANFAMKLADRHR